MSDPGMRVRTFEAVDMKQALSATAAGSSYTNWNQAAAACSTWRPTPPSGTIWRNTTHAKSKFTEIGCAAGAPRRGRLFSGDAEPSSCLRRIGPVEF